MSWCDLSEDLIIEIFSRLPSKSLLRFRSVSKSLYACISSPAFIRLHALRSPNKLMILHQFQAQSGMIIEKYTLHSEGQWSSDPYNIDTAAAYIYPFVHSKIIGSCNGIICLDHYRRGVSLWNPSTRRNVTLHDPRPSCSPIGFGFDPVINDYKVLMMSKTTGGVNEPSAFVYTVKADTWREIASGPTFTRDQTRSRQCLFNGSLHWVVKRCLTDSSGVVSCSCYISTFDLSSEVFSTIELPEPSWEANEVTIINGRLAVVSSEHGYSVTTSKDDESWIWVRTEQGNDTAAAASWSVVYKLNTREFAGVKGVFQLTHNGDLLINTCCIGIMGYNHETGPLLRYVGLSDSVCIRLLVTPCVESLELLDMGISCGQFRADNFRHDTNTISRKRSGFGLTFLTKFRNMLCFT